MGDESEAEKVSLTALPQRFVRYVLNFFVGLGIGLAPFLGTKNIPGFKALISVMPFQITSELIPLSAFLMGLIVVAVQFYSAERISRPTLRKRFKLALAVMGVGFVLFFYLRSDLTESMQVGHTTVTVLTGSTRIEGCGCPKGLNNKRCIARISLNPEAIETCWDSQEIKRRGEILGLSYLILTGGVGLLIGFLILQGEARRQARKKEAQARVKRPKRPGPAAPKAPPAGEPPGSPEPPPQDEPPSTDTP